MSGNPDRRRLLELFSTSSSNGITLFEDIKVLMDSADSDVRIAAANALGRLGDARAIEPLFRACMDEDIRVKQAAYEALSRLGPKVRYDSPPL